MKISSSFLILIFILTSSTDAKPSDTPSRYDCGSIDCKAIKTSGQSLILQHIASHTISSRAIVLTEDTMALMTYSLTSSRRFGKVLTSSTFDQLFAFLTARKAFLVSAQTIGPQACRMYYISSDIAKLQLHDYITTYCIINCITENFLETYKGQLYMYGKFVQHNTIKDPALQENLPETIKLYYSQIESPCDIHRDSSKEGACEHYNSSRLQRERYLLCRMASDIAALSRILELMQGEERIPNNAKQIRITANTLKDCANDLLKRLNAHSYPLAVRESDPAFEGDPFAVFQAYQRQAEQAARTARAALEEVRQARRP